MPLATAGALPAKSLRVLKSTACPASTYSSVAINCSSLRLRLGRTVELGLWRRVPVHDDRSGEAAALVVAGGRRVPVVAGAVQLECGRPARMVDQPDELRVAVARQHRAVRVLVVVDERQLEGPPVWQHEHAGLEDELVFRDPDRGLHLALWPLLSQLLLSAAEDSTQRRPVLLAQLGKRIAHTRFGSLAHGHSFRRGEETDET